MLYPLTFQPICMKRIWGGRRLEKLFGKKLPPEVPIGETWEISDRPEAISTITNGPLSGRNLHWLMENHAKDLLGDAPAINGRFPLLVKLIDAAVDLSIQVHPPDAVAEKLKGESKTEAWYIAHADPGAYIYAGLKNDITRETFETKLRSGTLAECIHCFDVKTGDALFVPSGRLHSLGGGTVVIEVQQNSDTTYRVFDWNRTGLDGNPRKLHIEQALASIDFNDFEPTLSQTEVIADQPGLFRMESITLAPGDTLDCSGLCVVGVASGKAVLDEIQLRTGNFALVPACIDNAVAQADTKTVLILARPV